MLIEVNETFCVQWANAQLEAGATAICYFDPVSSTSIITKDQYKEMGFKIEKRVIEKIKGPTAIHMASGRCLPIVSDIAETGTAVVGVSVDEDIGEMKSVCRNKISVLGNLNAVEMRRWTPDQVEKIVKETIARAGPGGGFILSDNHGEIPWQVPDDVLKALSTFSRHGVPSTEGGVSFFISSGP